jgi:hypothetical protein
MKTPLTNLIIAAFILNSLGPLPVRADDLRLPAPGVMVPLSPPGNPPVLKGVTVHPEDPFKFDFILDKGDTPTRGHGPEARRDRSVSPSRLPSNEL